MTSNWGPQLCFSTMNKGFFLQKLMRFRKSEIKKHRQKLYFYGFFDSILRSSSKYLIAITISIYFSRWMALKDLKIQVINCLQLLANYFHTESKLELAAEFKQNDDSFITSVFRINGQNESLFDSIVSIIYWFKD